MLVSSSLPSGLQVGVWIGTPSSKCPPVGREMLSLLLEQGHKGDGWEKRSPGFVVSQPDLRIARPPETVTRSGSQDVSVSGCIL